MRETVESVDDAQLEEAKSTIQRLARKYLVRIVGYCFSFALEKGSGGNVGCFTTHSTRLRDQGRRPVGWTLFEWKRGKMVRRHVTSKHLSKEEPKWRQRRVTFLISEAVKNPRAKKTELKGRGNQGLQLN